MERVCVVGEGGREEDGEGMTEMISGNNNI